MAGLIEDLHSEQLTDGLGAKDTRCQGFHCLHVHVSLLVTDELDPAPAPKGFSTTSAGFCLVSTVVMIYTVSLTSHSDCQPSNLDFYRKPLSNHQGKGTLYCRLADIMHRSPPLDLPYHIRNEIYKYYLDDFRIYLDSAFSAEAETRIPRARFANASSFYPNRSQFPHLTSTCRQLHEEVTPLVCSHVPFMAENFSVMTNWHLPIPMRFLENVRKLFVNESLIQVNGELDRLIFPHLPQLQLVSWQIDQEPPLADLLDGTPHSVTWRKEGPEGLLEALDKRNEYRAMRKVLAAQIQDPSAPWSLFMQAALQKEVAVEISHDFLGYQWRSAPDSSGDEHNGPIFVS